MDKKPWRFPRWLAVGAVALGIAGGSYGVASAASGSSGSGTSSPSSSGSAATTTPSSSTPSQPWGAQRTDETPLTGTSESKVREVALAKVPGGTIVRVETDADGNAAYEARMVKADGTPVTVYVNKQFDVASVELGMPGRPGRPSGSSSGASA